MKYRWPCVMAPDLLLSRGAYSVLIQRFATFWTETELASLRSRAARGLANAYLCAGLLIFGEARDSSSSTSRVGPDQARPIGSGLPKLSAENRIPEAVGRETSARDRGHHAPRSPAAA